MEKTSKRRKLWFWKKIHTVGVKEWMSLNVCGGGKTKPEVRAVFF